MRNVFLLDFSRVILMGLGYDSQRSYEDPYAEAQKQTQRKNVTSGG